MSKKTNRIAAPTTADRVAVIVALRIKGDRYGHAGIAALAKELYLNLDGDKIKSGAAKSLVESTGYDKGTVSRVGKILREDKSARSAVAKLNVMTIDDNEATLSAAVAVGEMFKRKPATSKTREAAEPDILADIEAWLNVEDADQFATRMSQIVATLARIEAERDAAPVEDDDFSDIDSSIDEMAAA